MNGVKNLTKRSAGRLLFRLGCSAPRMKPWLKSWGLRTSKEWFAWQRGAVQLQGGRSFYLGSIDQNYMSLELFWRGADYYEPITTRVLAELLNAGGTFLDLGANIGFHSLVQAAMNLDLKVVAFEPNPKLFRILSDNAAFNARDRITCVPCALSDTEGTALLHLSESDMSASLRDDFDPHRTGTTEVVRTESLDHFLTDFAKNERVVIKVDVEGQEERFLVGARETLSLRQPDLIMEVALRFSEQSNAILKDRGYHFYQITDKGLIESPELVPVTRGHLVFLNYLVSTNPPEWANALFARIADSVQRLDLSQTSKYVDDDCIRSLDTRRSSYDSVE